ncbi:MAG: copper amine oxidase N-terminal domain-containing protein [Clostridiales bacterium]|nr:copper amine oxidase N-terminal domain-containing protein [Clostridiales bacterium]MDY4036734.1 copper amine oxidase N-terminal domain-containing protein [Candidatus Pseudoscilispira sp.]
MKVYKKIVAALCAAAMMVSVLSVSAWAVPSGITVQVNGQEVPFPDAEPESKNGRTFIPVRAAFEALGAEVTWDQADKSVTAVKGDTTVVMALDSTKAEVTKDGQKQELTMDVAPYSKGGRTYVPVRFAAEAFSCAVGWDGDEHTVMIVDVDALLGDATFENLDGWVRADLEREVPNPVKTTGQMSLKMTMPDAQGKIQAYPLSATFSGISTDTKAELQMEMDFAELFALFAGGSDLSAADKAELKKLSQAAVETRMDLESGKIYFTIDCPLLLTMIGEGLGDGNVWYLMDLAKLSEAGGFDYQSYLQGIEEMLGSEYAGFRELMVSLLSDLELTSAAYDYEMLQTSAEILCALLSDQAMVKSGSNYTVNWALKEDSSVLGQIKMTYQTSGDRLVGVKMEMTIDDGMDGMTLKMNVREDGTNTTMDMDIDLGSDLKLSFALSAKTVQANAQPAVEPPAGAQIVDIMDVLDEASNGYNDLPEGWENWTDEQWNAYWEAAA